FEDWQRSVLDRLSRDRRVDVLLPTARPRALARTYAEAAVVAVPSTGPEALGLVALEAQACGTPVVVTRSGGVAESVDDGTTGLVIAPDDPAALAEAIARAPSLLGDGRGWGETHLSLPQRVGAL